jgi:hypothetical protein
MKFLKANNAVYVTAENGDTQIDCKASHLQVVDTVSKSRDIVCTQSIGVKRNVVLTQPGVAKKQKKDKKNKKDKKDKKEKIKDTSRKQHKRDEKKHGQSPSLSFSLGSSLGTSR